MALRVVFRHQVGRDLAAGFQYYEARQPGLGEAFLARSRSVFEAIERYPRHAALKRVLARRGVPIREDVRAPLRGLTDEERRELDEWLDALS